jgi:hypothetical protein
MQQQQRQRHQPFAHCANLPHQQGVVIVIMGSQDQHELAVSDHEQRATREATTLRAPGLEGGVESAVTFDLAQMALSGPVDASLAATALTLARALDGGAGLATAAVARELRATLAALAGRVDEGGDDGTHDLISRLSTASFNGPHPVEENVRGRSRRGGTAPR